MAGLVYRNTDAASMSTSTSTAASESAAALRTSAVIGVGGLYFFSSFPQPPFFFLFPSLPRAREPGEGAEQHGHAEQSSAVISARGSLSSRARGHLHGSSMTCSCAAILT